jgi:hypothetical protein
MLYPQSVASPELHSAPPGAVEDEPPLVSRGRYVYPPGLRFNLPFYLLRRFFKPANPILLFEYLRRFGRAAHYRILPPTSAKSSSTRQPASAKTAPRSA